MTPNHKDLVQEEESVFSKISPKVVQMLANNGITSPTPIQEQAFDPIMQGKDIIGQSRTGSGKTLAFGLGSFSRLEKSGSKLPRMLVLTPTRELAEQVALVFSNIFSVLGFKTIAITGGKSYVNQKRDLNRGVDAVVATPGRLCDLLDQGALSLKNIEILVLDEMDEMLDFGFSEDILRIKKSIEKKAQTLLFSATFPPKVQTIAKQMVENPFQIKVSVEENKSTGTIEHEFIEIKSGKALDALIGLLLFYSPEHAIIFCRTREETKNISQTLSERGFLVGVLNGEMTQKDRSDTMERFKSKNIKLLVATDVAARGIDVSGLSHVINYSVPSNNETYTHRTGRTGRAGAHGKAWTLVPYNQRREYQFIVSKLRIDPTRLELPALKKIAAQLIEKSLSQVKVTSSKAPSFVHKAVETYLEKVESDMIAELLKNVLVGEAYRIIGNFGYIDDIVPLQKTEFGFTKGGASSSPSSSRESSYSRRPTRGFKDESRKPSGNREWSSDKRPKKFSGDRMGRKTYK